MREILFRGKRVDNGEWVYGYVAHVKRQYRESWHYVMIVTDKKGTAQHDIYTRQIGQFTGLLDKNGTRIFEGDIVKFKPYNECSNAIIEWCENDAMFVTTPLSDDDDVGEYGMLSYLKGCVGNDNCEIIGNIHDNPELLKGEN